MGPSIAGHHKLLAQIAAENGGNPYHVTTAGSGATALDLATVAGPGVAALAPMAGDGIEAWPVTLPNRLGYVYKQVAEDVLAENRLFQGADTAGPQGGEHVYTVEVPDGLQRVTFALNWSMAGHQLVLSATNPSGNRWRALQ